MFREFSENNRSEEFLNEFRQKMADQTASNIEERQNELRRSRSVFIGTLAGLILAGIVGGFILSPHYNKSNVGNVPIIKRTPDVVKAAPKERGGMEIENQDKSVYEILENKNQEDIVVEKVLPAPEEPKLPTITAVEEPAPVTIDDIIDEASEEVVGDVAKVLSGQTTEYETTEKIVQISVKEEKVEKDNSAVEKKAEEIIVNNVKKVAEKGDWQVQIMSSPNKDSVEKSRQNLAKKYSFFNGLPYEIETADLGASGIYYRLKVGAFGDKVQADVLCENYKAQKGSCIVKKK